MTDNPLRRQCAFASADSARAALSQSVQPPSGPLTLMVTKSFSAITSSSSTKMSTCTSTSGMMEHTRCTSSCCSAVSLSKPFAHVSRNTTRVGRLAVGSGEVRMRLAFQKAASCTCGEQQLVGPPQPKRERIRALTSRTWSAFKDGGKRCCTPFYHLELGGKAWAPGCSTAFVFPPSPCAPLAEA